MKIIRCYLYDSNKMQQFISKVINYINVHRLSVLYFRKSSKNGFNLEIGMEDNDYKKLNIFLQSEILKFVTTYKQAEYDYFCNLIKSTAVLEESEADDKVYKDGRINIFESDKIPNLKSTVYANNVGIKILTEQTRLLRHIYTKFWQLEAANQDKELCKMFLIESDIYALGLKFGYLSMRSNFEYFKKQLEDKKVKEKAKQWSDYINIRTTDELEFIHTSVKIFLSRGYDQEYIFKEIKLFIQKCEEIFDDAYDKNELYIDNMYMPDDFFKRVKNPSEFHKELYTNNHIIKAYHEKKFIVYRFILSTLYSMLPNLNIPPLRRQKITGMVAESVEYYYCKTWQEIYQEMKQIDEEMCVTDFMSCH